MGLGFLLNLKPMNHHRFRYVENLKSTNHHRFRFFENLKATNHHRFRFFENLKPCIYIYKEKEKEMVPVSMNNSKNLRFSRKE